MKLIFLFKNIVLCTLFFSCVPTYAAIIEVQSATPTLFTDDTLRVDVLLNTEGQTVNAVEATISFNSEILEFIKPDDGNSALTFWIKKPQYMQNGLVHFSGITPGGFNADEALLSSLIFKVKKANNGVISIDEAQILLHDGNGTNAEVTKNDFEFAIPFDTKAKEGVPFFEFVDTELPEPFIVEVVSDPDVFKGKFFIVFDTQDKGVGIDHYEVKEGFFDIYRTAQSPHVLKYQKLDRKVYVKAVDRNRNERLAIFYPQQEKALYPDVSLIVSILILCVLIVLITYKIKARALRR